METHAKVMQQVIMKLDEIGHPINTLLPPVQKLIPHVVEFVVEMFDLETASDDEIGFTVEMFMNILEELQKQQTETIYQVVEPEKPNINFPTIDEIIDLPVDKQAEFADPICVMNVHNIEILKGLDSEINFEAFNATSIANLAFISINTQHVEYKEKAADWLRRFKVWYNRPV